MRKAACAANGGCAYQHCPERGDRAWEVLQGDHGTNPSVLLCQRYHACKFKFKLNTAPADDPSKEVTGSWGRNWQTRRLNR